MSSLETPATLSGARISSSRGYVARHERATTSAGLAGPDLDLLGLSGFFIAIQHAGRFRQLGDPFACPLIFDDNHVGPPFPHIRGEAGKIATAIVFEARAQASPPE
jgi:hypothetical protein